MKNEMQDLKFFCDKCGLCCEHLPKLDLYADLDGGTGKCIYFDDKTRLCTIYESRPLKCNVEKAYEWFQCHMSYEEYLQKNREACYLLKKKYWNEK